MTEQLAFDFHAPGDPFADLDFAHAARVLAAEADFRPAPAPRCCCPLGPLVFADQDVREGAVSSTVWQRVVDDRSGRLIVELAWETPDDYTPAAAFAAFVESEEPLAGTYRVDAGGRCATITYEPGRP